MQFATTFVAIFAVMMPLAAATPSPDTIELFNGDGVVTTTVGERDLNVLATRGGVCSGSALCSNSQSLKNACETAYNRIEQTTYSNSGSKSGVCDGHCGIFVQGTYKDGAGKTQQCTATGADLQNAYNTIRNDGCQTCGHIPSAQSSSCLLKIDYVASC
jgi:hypothetical protein